MAKNLGLQLDSEKDSISNPGRGTSPGKPHSILPQFVRRPSRDNRLLPGDWVRVKSYREIERTLDDEGAFDGCQFTEPMARYCSGEFHVQKRVELYFDELQFRRLRCRNVVLLDEPVCDGSVHPDGRGCDRSCQFFWKTEWLEKIPEDERGDPVATPSAPGGSEIKFRDHGSLNQCQIMTTGAGGWEPWTWKLRRRMWVLTSRARNIYRHLTRIVPDRKFSLVHSPLPHCQPWETKHATRDSPLAVEIETTAETLWNTVRPGDLVRVRRKVEIDQTLDDRGYHKGCYFMPSMAHYYEQHFRVLRRVSLFYDEALGKLVQCRNLVALDGAFCDGSGNPATSGCDRMCFAFWRTEWLEPVEDSVSGE